LEGSDELKHVEDDFTTVSCWVQWHQTGSQPKNWNDRSIVLQYSKKTAKGRTQLHLIPESEFVAERGTMRVKYCSVRYLNGPEQVSVDGEVLPYWFHESRTSWAPLPATLLA